VRRLGFDSRFIRMWDYYLACCEAAFAVGYLGDLQLVLGRPMEALGSRRAFDPLDPAPVDA
jgi:cyclopropane-fatty-acyl-phospholipid synthase